MRISERTIDARNGPKFSPFEDGKHNMDAYLRRFEKYATIRRWHRRGWAVYMAALLKVYWLMPPDQYDDCDALKDALLKRYQLTAEGFRKRFNNCIQEVGESNQQFITKLDTWIELSKLTQDFDGLKSLLVNEQYLAVGSRELSLF